MSATAAPGSTLWLPFHPQSAGRPAQPGDTVAARGAGVDREGRLGYVEPDLGPGRPHASENVRGLSTTSSPCMAYRNRHRLRCRLVTATDSICAPGQGRFARWRALSAAVLTLLVMVFLPPLLVQAGVADDFWLFPAFFAHIAAAGVYLMAISPWRPEMRGRLLTARTLSGRCTVDLNRLTRVGRLVIPSQPASSSIDWLMLADGHGVRLAVQEPRAGASRYAEQAIARTALAPTNRVRVSRWAMKRLRPPEFRAMSCLWAGAKAFFWVVLGGAVVTGAGIALLMLSLQLSGEN
jgi:hypothetical protein